MVSEEGSAPHSPSPAGRVGWGWVTEPTTAAALHDLHGAFPQLHPSCVLCPEGGEFSPVLEVGADLWRG